MLRVKRGMSDLDAYQTEEQPIASLLAIEFKQENMIDQL